VRRITLGSIALAAALALTAEPAAAAPACETIGKPGPRSAWRAEVLARTPLWEQPGTRSRGSIRPGDASWLLVLRAQRDDAGRCWLHVRLPTRPNDAAAWLNADRVALASTRWRIDISRRARTLTLYRDGERVRRFRAVVGKPETPTPRGLFAVYGVWRSDPRAFLGSYIVAITAHSNVLQEYDGGDGRVAIHGRGGASLNDPLGTAHSHGCVRLDNRAIESIVRTVGAHRLPGIPVRVVR
jgi:lipoprotein-anchoring transpeptidase ErfK/SrfK